MYGRRATATEKGGTAAQLPPGYGEPGPEGGRPRTHASHYGTNDGLGGRDPLGTHGMKGGFDSDNENVNEEDKKIDNTLAKSTLYQNKNLFQNTKKIIFENKEQEEDSLLDESQIEDLDK